MQFFLAIDVLTSIAIVSNRLDFKINSIYEESIPKYDLRTVCSKSQAP